jgi:hypothetical protein
MSRSLTQASALSTLVQYPERRLRPHGLQMQPSGCLITCSLSASEFEACRASGKSLLPTAATLSRPRAFIRGPNRDCLDKLP